MLMLNIYTHRLDCLGNTLCSHLKCHHHLPITDFYGICGICQAPCLFDLESQSKKEQCPVLVNSLISPKTAKYTDSASS